MILVDAERVSMSRPGRPLFTDLSVTINSGDRLAIVGLNGCGKSTLVRVLAGRAEPESGVVRRGRGVRIAMLDQNPQLGTGAVRDVVAQAGGEAWEAESVLDRIGMGAYLDTPVTELSGGQAKRVALARTLVTECDLLVLDEPTNHLDIDGIAWLEDRLAAFSGGLLLVTHDRHVLDRVTTRILELDRGRGYVHDGGYAGYLEGRLDREAAAVETEAVRANLARRELAWLRRGAPARTSKAKARIRTATELVNRRPEAAARSGELDWHTDTPRLGDQVIEVRDVSLQRGGTELLRHVDLDLGPRERLGIVGVNGTGKSSLLDLMAGRLAPDAGEIVTGPTVQLGYYDQTGRELDLSQRVRDAVVPGDGEPDWRDARLLERFWFDADAQYAPIELLSGGERRRLQLVMVLAAQPNVVFLDEPTNDLDLDTLRSLEDYLEDFPGAVVVVSHDRAFLERTVDDVVVLDGSGRVGRIPGGYEAWENERRAARGGTAGQKSTEKANQKADQRTKQKPSDPGSGPSRSTLRFQLKEVERTMRPIERKRATLAVELDGATDHDTLARVGAQVAELDAQLAELEERWLVVAEQLES
ncbi:MAG: ABC-F family ATP-binding cassette domain-containing protein [Acidimicrobiales bacterium]|nr:ABC-F family ATP-binding cassette domain-containing protein [Acidimicrobiales bacterium]